MAAPSILENGASRANIESNNRSAAVAAVARNCAMIPSRPIADHIVTSCRALKTAANQRFACVSIQSPVPRALKNLNRPGGSLSRPQAAEELIRQGALGGGQRQVEVMRDRRVGQEAPAGV